MNHYILYNRKADRVEFHVEAASADEAVQEWVERGSWCDAIEVYRHEGAYSVRVAPKVEKIA